MRLVLDLETYYDDTYSLKKMHTLEYVRDERFLVHGCAVKVDDEDTIFVPGEAFKIFIDSLPDDVELICHNTYFDGLVLYHHYQFVPETYRDTQSMAKGLLPHAPSHSLDNLCSLLGLGEKIPEVLGLTKGLRHIPPELFAQLGEYAKNDVELTDLLYRKLEPGLPDEELQLIDLTMRWGCRPVLHVDLPRAEAALRVSIASRNDAIEASGTTLEVLSSQPKFRAYLEDLNIEVPMKKNKKGDLIPALGKDDLGFRQMLADYPEHDLLFKGRLAAKSTLDVTRTQRVVNIGSRGTLPMPLKYYGAHTGRWSGADGLNPQNFRRGSELRKSIIAPPGWVVLVADLKQIEVRLNMWYCNQHDWVQIFRDGVDVYSALAADHFSVPLEEVTGEQRFFGKTLELGLGYQMGWEKFRNTCALRGIFLSEQKSYETVTHYRSTHHKVQSKWHVLKAHLNSMYSKNCYIEDGPVTFTHEAIQLPNGMQIDYSGLEPTETGNWFYGLNGRRIKIYGGKMLENLIQALGRVVLGENLLEIERCGITTVSSTHDEPIMVVREAEADDAVKEVTKIMTTPPTWAPDLPVEIDIGYAREYSK